MFISVIRRMVSYNKYIKDYLIYKNLDKRRRFSISIRDMYPCLGDANERANFDRHYVYHTSWAARILASRMPCFHVDLSSSLYFAGIVSAFIPVRHFDFRRPDIALENLSVGTADLCSLPFEDESLTSISCMHVVEHIGLGRYGDPLDPEGDLKAIVELKRVLASDGSLIFVVPIGRPRIMFNAHRIYSYDQISSLFSDLKWRNLF